MKDYNLSKLRGELLKQMLYMWGCVGVPTIFSVFYNVTKDKLRWG